MQALVRGESPPRLLLTEREAARALAVSPRTIWSLADSGQLPVVRIGRAKRYTLRDIESLVQRLKGQACAQKETPAAGGQTGARELQNEHIKESGPRQV